MIDRGDIRQAIDRCSNIWGFTAGRCYGQFEHKADSLIAKSQRSVSGTVREIDVWAESPRLFRSAIRIIVCLSCGLLIITVITPLPTKPSDKNARELKLANAAITDMQMRQRDVAALDAKYTKELADAKAENDALWRRRRSLPAAHQRKLPPAWSNYRWRG